ncbi:MAG TPA: DUF2130 domain-containing protein [Tepidisphaeraceae bacterium]|jgi:hypothetical protein|nr:DUF2130 domain-containing protein [Tepidisphaeraceae bacterium]
MSEPTITCPGCKIEIKLNESLAAPLIESTRREFEKRLSQQNTEINKREQAIKDRETLLAQEKEAVDQKVIEKVKLERGKIAAEESKKAKLALGNDLEQKVRELGELQEVLKTRDEKLAEAQKAQADVIRQRRELEDARREMDLTVEKRIQENIGAAKAAVKKEVEESLGLKVSEKEQTIQAMQKQLAEAQQAQAEVIRQRRELDDAKREMELTIEKGIQEKLAKVKESARKEADESLGLKVFEKEQIIQTMQRQIEELKRKAEQGSQQLQGEVLELQLELILGGKFHLDRLEPVPKGEHGGDILHRIIAPTGTGCGTILWETKRTKNWVAGWLPKLREDQRAAKAEIAVLVSAQLPEGVDTFDQVDGIWVTHPRNVIPVAMCLRNMLMEVQSARQASEGQQTKMELIYQYLTGAKFRLRVQAIVESFSNMSDDLQKEKRAITKQWEKRQRQIDMMMEATAGMYGELQGIAGKSLQEIQGLDMNLLEDQAAGSRLSNDGAARSVAN